jgi:hypothetical protein
MTFKDFASLTHYLQKKIKTSGLSLVIKATTDLSNDIKSRHGKYPSDIRWAPLKPATIKRKGRDTPLIDTGSMQSAVTWSVNGDKGEVFTDHSIAAIQEYGAILQGGAIPPRPIWRPAVDRLDQNFEEQYAQLVTLD